MTTLTYDDLLYIRDALVERRGTMLSASLRAAKIEDDEMSGELMRDWNGMGKTLDRVESMIEQIPRMPNAETLAAMEEAKNWRNLPSYKTVEEALASVDDDDD